MIVNEFWSFLEICMNSVRQNDHCWFWQQWFWLIDFATHIFAFHQFLSIDKHWLWNDYATSFLMQNLACIFDRLFQLYQYDQQKSFYWFLNVWINHNHCSHCNWFSEIQNLDFNLNLLSNWIHQLIHEILVILSSFHDV